VIGIIGSADTDFGDRHQKPDGCISTNNRLLTCLFDASVCFQVVAIPEEIIESHDLTVDYILTPTRVIKTSCLFPKPHGIFWNKVISNAFSLSSDIASLQYRCLGWFILRFV